MPPTAISDTPEKQLLERIVVNPEVMVGQPVIKGTRLTVQFILNLLANDIPFEKITEEYEGITKQDILACLSFAARVVGNTSLWHQSG